MTRDDRFKVGDVVALLWLDSKPRSGWVKDADIRLGTIKSAGIIVAVDDEKLVMSTSTSSDGWVFDPLGIPWGGITTIEMLDLGKP